MSDPVFREEIYYTGRVQGVGFRYATLQAAKEFEVVGEVKNLPDGRVYLCAEGQEGEVRAFVDEVADRLKPFIRGADAHSGRGERNYRGFAITQ